MYGLYVFGVYLKIDLKHFSKVYKKCKYDDGDDDDGNVQLPPAVASRTTVQWGQLGGFRHLSHK